MPQQTPYSEGVKDLPAVPGSLNHGKPGHKAPPLGPVGDVPANGGNTNRKVS